jgi:hypothetical protein
MKGKKYEDKGVILHSHSSVDALCSSSRLVCVGGGAPLNTNVGHFSATAFEFAVSVDKEKSWNTVFSASPALKFLR